MRLLFDENLSPRLVRAIADLWPESTHHYAIVTKDDDFRALAFVKGAPPKILWLQVGNASTMSIATMLRDSASDIAAFEADRDAALLVLRR